MFFFDFGLFQILFGLVSALVIGVIIFTVIKGITQWSRNNHSPRLTVSAKIVGKRTHTSHSHNPNTHMMTASTSHYVTFEVESGDRMELHVSGSEYGLLAEGDRGRLTFQGTRYLNFQRNNF